MKWLIAFALLLTVSVATALGLSQDVGNSVENIQLDLPYNGGDRKEEEKEGAEIIFFYGQQFEGDVFIFCVDRSGSMGMYGALACAKREMCRTIKELSPEAEFAICFFDTGSAVWPSSGRPAKATSINKGKACDWVSRMVLGRQSCPQSALLRSLRMINSSEKSRRCIVYVGDGGGTCFKDGWKQSSPSKISANPEEGFEDWYLLETLDKVDRYNFKEASINTIGVMMGPRFNVRHHFVSDLAQRNNGTCRIID